MKLLAPNGKPSNLTPEQYRLVRTTAFKSWFGDWENDPENSSKVVDENGEPLVCYHGTRSDFNEFKRTRFGKLGEAMYFTSIEKDAIRYAKKYDGVRVIKAFLNSKNLAEISSPFAKKELPETYDGVMASKGVVGGEEIVVFEPNQIKLADGSNTTFDGSNPDIRFDDGGGIGIDVKTPIYTAIFINKDELIKKYKPVHKNIFYHHSTIEFKPQDVTDFPKGQETKVDITGRLTTDKVDVLLVNNQLSKKKNPHITLSTAEGVSPMQSDIEIEENLGNIIPLNDSINGIYDVFYGDNSKITSTDNGGNQVTLKYIKDGKELGYLNYIYDDKEPLSVGLDLHPFNFNSEMYIDFIEVYEDYMGKGIAKKLINKAISDANELGVVVVTLRRDSGLGCNYGSEYDNMLKKLYSSLGFTETWTEKDAKLSGGEKNICAMHLKVYNKYNNGGQMENEINEQEFNEAINTMIVYGKQNNRKDFIQAANFIRDFDLDNDVLIKAKYEEIKNQTKRLFEEQKKSIRESKEYKELPYNDYYHIMNDVTSYRYIEVIGRVPKDIQKIKKETKDLKGAYKKVVDDYIRSIELFVPIAIKVEKLKNKIVKKLPLTPEQKEDKAMKELRESIYESMPTINKEVLSKMVEEIKETFKPLEKIIYERETKRYHEIILKIIKDNEVYGNRLSDGLLPFYNDIFDYKTESRKSEPKIDFTGNTYYIQEHWLIDLSLKNNWKEVVSKVVLQEIEMLKYNMLYSIVSNFRKITAPIEKIEQLRLYVGEKGFEGAYKFTFKNGSSFVFQTQSISAGGYNIQKYHFRYLTHFTDIILSDGKKASSNIDIHKYFSVPDAEINPYTKIDDAPSQIEIAEIIVDAIKNGATSIDPKSIKDIKVDNDWMRRIIVSVTYMEDGIQQNQYVYLDLLSFKKSQTAAKKFLKDIDAEVYQIADSSKNNEVEKPSVDINDDSDKLKNELISVLKATYNLKDRSEKIGQKYSQANDAFKDKFGITYEEYLSKGNSFFDGGQIETKYYLLLKNNKPIFRTKFSGYNIETEQDMSDMLDKLQDMDYILKPVTEDEYKEFKYSDIDKKDLAEFTQNFNYFKKGGEVKRDGKIEFRRNRLPRRDIYEFAKMVKTKYPKVWAKGGNIFGNEAFNRLDKVIKRGYWLPNEEWMQIKWQSYIARHHKDFRIEGVVAMLKWIATTDKGWRYMKNLINEEIKKQYPNADDNYKYGGAVELQKKVLLAPNGKPTNLTPEQYKLVRTPEFKAWFGDWEKLANVIIKDSAIDEITLRNISNDVSKVVDENGEPVVCFHGSNNDFNEFRSDVGYSTDKGYYGKGFYFTFNTNGEWMKFMKGEAGYYGSIVKEFFIKSLNPFDISELSEYKGIKISYVGTETIVFLSNIAKRFPELADSIFLEKEKWNEKEQLYDIIDVPISVLPELISKYQKLLKTFIFEDGRGNKMKSGYVKSEIVEYDYTSTGGKKGSYERHDDLGGRYSEGISDTEVEIMLIVSAIEKYDGIKANYHPEGYMTRNPEITNAIKKNHDSIMTTKSGDEIVVFEPTQIKLADGTNTTFDSMNPDIRFSKGGGLELELVETYYVKHENGNDYLAFNNEFDGERNVFRLSKDFDVEFGYTDTVGVFMYTETYMKRIIAEYFRKVSFVKFGNLFRKYIDDKFSQEYNLQDLSKTYKWSEKASYIIGDGSYYINNQKNFIDFCKEAKIKIPSLPNKESVKFDNGGGVENKKIRDFKEIKNFKYASLGSQYIDMLDDNAYAQDKINSNRWFDLVQKNNKKGGLTDKEFIELKDLSDKVARYDEDMESGGELGKQCPVGTKVQTLIFSKDDFSEQKAKDWAKEHGYKYTGVDEKENTYRIRQADPKDFVKDIFRTIEFKKGIKAVVACPKN